jgi:hypothetical protein
MGTYAGDVYIVTGTKDGETEYWVAATPRDEALDAVRDQIAPGWTPHLTDQLLPSEMVVQLDMRADSVLRLKVSWANLASGQEAAAPLTSVMNSRRRRCE